MEVNNSWMTTFIYEQDLRSYYMNNILYPLIHTGVYNADISISTSNGIMYLNIRKGTTLIFSNDYVDIKKEVENGKTEFNSINNEIWGRSFNGKSEVSMLEKGESKVSLIKCVALQDISLRLNVNSDIISITGNEGIPFIDMDGFNETAYVCAVIRYSTESSTSETEPQFRLLVNNKEYTTEYGENFTTDSKYFYKFMKPNRNGATDNLSITDGNPPDGVPKMNTTFCMISWLMLGIINPIDRSRKYVGSNNRAVDFNGDWYRNHIFTGRGIPEYRYPLYLGKETLSPEVMFDTPYLKKDSKGNFLEGESIGYKKIYLDINKIVNNGRVYSSPIDWRQFYGVGPFKHISKIAESGSSTEYNPDMIKIEFSPVREYVEHNVGNIQGQKDILIYDVVFACFRNNITNKDSMAISKRKPNLLSYRGHIIEDPNNSDIMSKFPKDIYSNEALVSRELYMDISPYNVNKLIEAITNRDFLSIAIEGLRKNGGISPESNGESLVPVCIVFRPFSINKTESSLTLTPYGLPLPVNGDTDKDKYLDCINPSCVLSFFDMTYKMTEVNPVTVKAQDVFTVIPVMN